MNKCDKCDTPGGKKTYENQVCMPLNGKVVCIDHCIHQIVAALNAGGVRTVACCCGHNEQKGRIDLADGRILRIESSKQEVREHPEIEAGKWWVVDTGHEWVLYVTNVDLINIYGYAFNYKGKWYDNNKFGTINSIESARLADIETEVLPLLEKEAKRRGLVPGVRAMCMDDKKIFTISDKRHKSPEGVGYWLLSEDNYGIQIMDKYGKWTEPRKDQWKVTLKADLLYAVSNGTQIISNITQKQAFSIAKLFNKEGL